MKQLKRLFWRRNRLNNKLKVFLPGAKRGTEQAGRVVFIHVFGGFLK